MVPYFSVSASHFSFTTKQYFFNKTKKSEKNASCQKFKNKTNQSKSISCVGFLIRINANDLMISEIFRLLHWMPKYGLESLHLGDFQTEEDLFIFIDFSAKMTCSRVHCGILGIQWGLNSKGGCQAGWSSARMVVF